jgi:hypothetical protein
MDKIKDQANLVSQLVFSTETGDIYKKALTRTWDILRETGLLLWLVICLTFVGGEWFYRKSVKLGRDTRAWYEGLKTKDTATTNGQTMQSTGQALLNSVQSSTAYLLTQARKQLGLKEPEPTSTPPATSVSYSAPAAKPPVAPPPSSPTAPVPPPEIASVSDTDRSA